MSIYNHLLPEKKKLVLSIVSSYHTHTHTHHDANERTTLFGPPSSPTLSFCNDAILYEGRAGTNTGGERFITPAGIVEIHASGLGGEKKEKKDEYMERRWRRRREVEIYVYISYDRDFMIYEFHHS